MFRQYRCIVYPTVVYNIFSFGCEVNWNMAIELEILKECRLCNGIQGGLHPIDPYIEFIAEMMSIEVTQDDDLSKLLCGNCNETLETWTELKKISELSQLMNGLSSFINQQKTCSVVSTYKETVNETSQNVRNHQESEQMEISVLQENNGRKEKSSEIEDDANENLQKLKHRRKSVFGCALSNENFGKLKSKEDKKEGNKENLRKFRAYTKSINNDHNDNGGTPEPKSSNNISNLQQSSQSNNKFSFYCNMLSHLQKPDRKESNSPQEFDENAPQAEDKSYNSTSHEDVESSNEVNLRRGRTSLGCETEHKSSNNLNNFLQCPQGNKEFSLHCNMPSHLQKFDENDSNSPQASEKNEPNSPQEEDRTINSTSHKDVESASEVKLSRGRSSLRAMNSGQTNNEGQDNPIPSKKCRMSRTQSINRLRTRSKSTYVKTMHNEIDKSQSDPKTSKRRSGTQRQGQRSSIDDTKDGEISSTLPKTQITAMQSKNDKIQSDPNTSKGSSNTQRLGQSSSKVDAIDGEISRILRNRSKSTNVRVTHNNNDKSKSEPNTSEGNSSTQRQGQGSSGSDPIDGETSRILRTRSKSTHVRATYNNNNKRKSEPNSSEGSSNTQRQGQGSSGSDTIDGEISRILRTRSKSTHVRATHNNNNKSQSEPNSSEGSSSTQRQGQGSSGSDTIDGEISRTLRTRSKSTHVRATHNNNNKSQSEPNSSEGSSSTQRQGQGSSGSDTIDGEISRILRTRSKSTHVRAMHNNNNKSKSEPNSSEGSSSTQRQSQGSSGSDTIDGEISRILRTRSMSTHVRATQNNNDKGQSDPNTWKSRSNVHRQCKRSSEGDTEDRKIIKRMRTRSFSTHDRASLNKNDNPVTKTSKGSSKTQGQCPQCKKVYSSHSNMLRHSKIHK